MLKNENKHGNKLREVRKFYGLTQLQFAEKYNMKQATITDIERGRIGFSETLLAVLFNDFNISPNWFFLDRSPMLLSDVEDTQWTTTKGIENSKDVIHIIACLEKGSLKARLVAKTKFGLTDETINTVIDQYAAIDLEENPAQIHVEIDKDTCFTFNTTFKP